MVHLIKYSTKKHKPSFLWLVFEFYPKWFVFPEFSLFFSSLQKWTLKLILYETEAPFLFLVLFAVLSLYLDKKANQQPKTSGNPVFPDGMPIRKELCLEMNTGFILRIRRLMMNRLSWMPSHLKTWWTGQSTRKCFKENISWFRRALWAPAVIHANDKYYIFFGANDIQSNNELGGIGVAVADNPAGPFKDALGKPLIDKFVNGATDRSVCLQRWWRTILYVLWWLGTL